MAEGSDSGTYTPEAIARRFAMAQALLAPGKERPITHWAQGLNELAQGALGGYQYGQAEKMEREAKDASARTMAAVLGLPAPPPRVATPSAIERIAGLFGGGDNPSPIASGTDMTAPVSPVAAPPNYGSAISSIESSGKYDALGPVTKTGDRAYGKYQVMGANIPEWTQAVTGKRMTPQEFLADPKAQDTLFQGKFGEYTKKYGPEGAARAWFAGEDGMNDMGRRDQLGTSVADYGRKFATAMGGPGMATPPASGAAAIASALAAPAEPAGTPTAPPVSSVAPASTAAPRPLGTAPGAFGGIPEAQRRQIGALLSNPGTAPMGQALLAKAIAKEKEEFRPLTDPSERQKYGVPAEDKTPYQIDQSSGKVVPMNTAPTTNVALNTALKGQEVMATESAKDFQTAQATARDATKRTAVWDAMEQAAKGFTPGATADMKLTAKRYLKDLGFIGDEGVSDAETFKQMQQQIAIHSQPKGQGAVSNIERELFAKAIPNITMSPEGLKKSIEISRKLDDFDRKVADVYRVSARKNGGVPNSIDINEEIDKMGSPLSVSERNMLHRASESKGSTAVSAPTPAATAPVRVASPEEARKLPKGTPIILPDGSPGVVP